jgi:hypothetical protein
LVAAKFVGLAPGRFVQVLQAVDTAQHSLCGNQVALLEQVEERALLPGRITKAKIVRFGLRHGLVIEAQQALPGVLPQRIHFLLHLQMIVQQFLRIREHVAGRRGECRQQVQRIESRGLRRVHRHGVGRTRGWNLRCACRFWQSTRVVVGSVQKNMLRVYAAVQHNMPGARSAMRVRPRR